jgi:hypothetical protein
VESEEIPLAAGAHPIRVRWHNENYDGAILELQWRMAGSTTYVAVPEANFSPY